MKKRSFFENYNLLKNIITSNFLIKNIDYIKKTINNDKDLNREFGVYLFNSINQIGLKSFIKIVFLIILLILIKIQMIGLFGMNHFSYQK